MKDKNISNKQAKYTLRLDAQLLRALRYIAEYEDVYKRQGFRCFILSAYFQLFIALLSYHRRKGSHLMQYL